MTYHIEKQNQDGKWVTEESAGTQLPSWGFAYHMLEFYDDGHTTRWAIVPNEEQ